MTEFEKAIKYLKKKDPAFAKLAKKHKKIEFAPELKRSPYESLVRSISHQQLHASAAQAILKRLTERFDKTSKFPLPQDLINLPDSEFRACGYSGSKTKAIKDIALKAIEGTIPDLKKAKKSSNEELINEMSQAFGVGKWTVEMFLIFGLGRLNVWPIDDFGVRNGFRIWKKKAEMPTPKQLEALGSKWTPYRTVVALYLWREADLSRKVKKTKAPVKKSSNKS